MKPKREGDTKARFRIGQVVVYVHNEEEIFRIAETRVYCDQFEHRSSYGRWIGERNLRPLTEQEREA